MYHQGKDLVNCSY